MLSNNRRQRDVPRARALLERHRHRRRQPQPATILSPLPPLRCPHCGYLGLRWMGFQDAHGQTHLQRAVPICDSS
jgi:hypothetical protein